MNLDLGVLHRVSRTSWVYIGWRQPLAIVVTTAAILGLGNQVAQEGES